MSAVRFVGTRRDRRFTRLVAAFAAGIILAGATVPVGTPMAAQQMSTAAVAFLPGARKAEVCELYRRNCLRCHEQDGKGVRSRTHMPGIPDFTNSTWQEDRTDNDFTISIQEGKGSHMPAFPGKFSRDEIQELVAQLRSFASPRPKRDKSDEKDFERRYRALRQELEELRKQYRELAEMDNDAP